MPLRHGRRKHLNSGRHISSRAPSQAIWGYYIGRKVLCIPICEKCETSTPRASVNFISSISLHKTFNYSFVKELSEDTLHHFSVSVNVY